MIDYIYYFFHFLYWIVGTQHCAAERNAIYACVKYVVDIVLGDAANCHDGDIDMGRTHLDHYAAIAIQSQYGRKVLLGGGESERTTADIICTSRVVSPYIPDGVGCAADNEIGAQYASCLGDRHIVLAQMHTIGT